MKKPPLAHALMLALALAIVTPPVMSQNTTGELAGQIVSTDGAPLAEVTVEVLHLPSGTKKQVITNGDGRFVARGLRVGGPYQVLATKDGFDAGNRDNVQVPLGQTATVNLKLATDAAELEAVEVTASEIDSYYDSTRTGASTNISRSQIEQMPTVSFSIADYAKNDPRITVTDKATGAVSAAGQNNRYNTITIDGVKSNDDFGLNASGLPSQNQPIASQWLEEFNIGISPFDVSRGDFVGAAINAVTKSGTNTFDGGLYSRYREAGMVRENTNGTDFRGFDDELVNGAYVGGPIIKDRLYFFFGYEDFQRGSPKPDVGPVGSGASTIVPGVTEAFVDSVRQVAQSRYGFDIGGLDYPSNENTDDKIIGKIDFNLNDAHRFGLRYNRTAGDEQRFRDFNVTNLPLSSYLFSQNTAFENYVAQWYGDWTSNFSTEVGVSLGKYRSAPTNAVTAPQVILNVAPGSREVIRFGTEQFRHANLLKTDQATAFAAGTWYSGAHTVKFGFDFANTDIYNLFLESFLGRFTFNSLADFETGRSASYTLRLPTDRSDLGSAAAVWKYNNLGLFLQDTFQISDSFALTYGLRLDRPDVLDTPIYNATFEQRFGLDNTTTVDGNGVPQPRVGFNWTFGEERLRVLRGGLGLFTGSAPGVWLSNPFTNNGRSITEYVASSGINIFTSVPVTDPETQLGLTASNALASVDVLSEDFRQPTVWKGSLGFDMELNNGWITSAEAELSETRDNILFTHLNLGNVTSILPDGRNAYWSSTLPANHYLVTGQARINANSRAGGTTPGFNNVILLSNTGKGRTSNLTLSLSAPSNEWGLSWRLGYTFGDSTDVNSGVDAIANSSWEGRPSFNVNEEDATTSNFEIKGRGIGVLTYVKEFISGAATTISLFGEMRAGRPFSYGYINDANGDRVAGNDLFYIPQIAADGSMDVILRNRDGSPASDATRQAFIEFIQDNNYLNEHQGQVAERNGDSSPWVQQFDLHIGQQLPEFWGIGQGEIFLNILNIGNLINEDWGHVDEMRARSFGVAEFRGVENGQYVYSFPSAPTTIYTRQDTAGESRWVAQVGIKWEF